MSFDILDSTKINNRNTITHNYYSTQIYLNQFHRTFKTDGYIQLPFVSNKPDPNILSDLFQLQYTCLNLYITKSHNLIKDVSYNAELIIQHDSTTNNDSTYLYTCIPLKTVSNSVNSPIDKIITPSSDVQSISLTLNELINPQSNKIYYKDKKGNQVIIYSSPLSVNTLFDISLGEPNIPLFETTSSNYSVIVPSSQNLTDNPVKEGFVEGLTQTAYCQPVDTVDPDMTIEPELSIPLVGKYTSNDATNNATRTAINFMSFVLVLAFTVIITPIIYDNYIVGLIIKETGQGKMDRLRSIDIYTCVVFIYIIFTLIMRGIQTNNSNLTLIGFFIGLFFFISMAVIQFKKMDSNWLQQTFNAGGTGPTVSYKNTSYFNDLGSFLGENAKVIMTPSNMLVLLLITGIFYFLVYIFGGFKTKKNAKSSISGYIYTLTYTLILGAYITVVVTSLNTNTQPA